MRHVGPRAAARHPASPPEERSLTDPQYIGSFPRADTQLDPPLPEVAFLGRSNVGKSSLLYARAGKAQRAAFRGLLKHALLREQLRGVVWLLDIRHPPSVDDRVMQDVLAEGAMHVLAALTKGDKLSREQRRIRERDLRGELELPEDQVLVTSARTGEGIAELREAIAGLIEATA